MTHIVCVCFCIFILQLKEKKKFENRCWTASGAVLETWLDIVLRILLQNLNTYLTTHFYVSIIIVIIAYWYIHFFFFCYFAKKNIKFFRKIRTRNKVLVISQEQRVVNSFKYTVKMSFSNYLSPQTPLKLKEIRTVRHTKKI